MIGSLIFIRRAEMKSIFAECEDKKLRKTIYFSDLTLQSKTVTKRLRQIAQQEKEYTSKRNTRSKNQPQSPIQNGSNNGKTFDQLWQTFADMVIFINAKYHSFQTYFILICSAYV